VQHYLIRRVLWSIPGLLGVTLLAFIVIRVVPGDVVHLMAGEGGPNAHLSAPEAQKLRRQLGLDKPLPVQYVIWLGNALRGDFGRSVWTRRAASEEISRRLPITAELAILSSLIAIAIAIPVGVLAAVRRDTPLDYVCRIVSICGLAMPGFWLATMVIVLLSTAFHYLPPVGYKSLQDSPGINLQQMIWPALVLGFALSASTMRMTRSALLEVLRQDYVRTAWAKGLRERSVIVRHALKNAMIPIITIVGTQVGILLGGSVIMERIFALPGLGQLTVDSIFQRDYPQLQANVVTLASVFILVNLLIDLSYAWLDPRIRYA